MLSLAATRFHAPSSATVEAAVRARGYRWAAVALLLAGFFLALPVDASECPDILRYQFPSLTTGETQDLCQYQGKAVLVINTALLRNKLGAIGFHAVADDGVMLNPRVAARRFRAAMLRWRCWCS